MGVAAGVRCCSLWMVGVLVSGRLNLVDVCLAAVENVCVSKTWSRGRVLGIYTFLRAVADSETW